MKGLIKKLLIEGLLDENTTKETVKQFYNRFNKEHKGRPTENFLVDSFRNPNFELRLTNGGGVRSANYSCSLHNRCETNTFNFIKETVLQDDHRFFPVSGWMFQGTTFLEHFWVYDAVNDMFMDITPMSDKKLPYAYGGVINKGINDKISKAESYQDVEFLLGKAMHSLYNSKYTGNSFMDSESNPKLDDYQSNEKSSDEKLFNYIHTAEEYKELSDLIGNRYNTLEELNMLTRKLSELRDKVRNNREWDYYERMIKQIKSLNTLELKRNYEI